MQNSYRFALACGAVPLVTGILFFLAWFITRLDVLTQVAGLVIVISLFLVLAGCVALTRFAWQALRSPDLPRDRVWKAIIIAGTVLSLNLPVIAGLVGQALPKREVPVPVQR
ncbi:MAG: hypothetical protein EOP84_03525 [Verrucomicrobiaceae bacterium]|nr:MAG: hypothetical protein EOP84_03525 [Verrucomicrobiaceae bacterium]